MSFLIWRSAREMARRYADHDSLCTRPHRRFDANIRYSLTLSLDWKSACRRASDLRRHWSRHDIARMGASVQQRAVSSGSICRGLANARRARLSAFGLGHGSSHNLCRARDEFPEFAVRRDRRGISFPEAELVPGPRPSHKSRVSLPENRARVPADSVAHSESNGLPPERDAAEANLPERSTGPEN